MARVSVQPGATTGTPHWQSANANGSHATASASGDRHGTRKLGIYADLHGANRILLIRVNMKASDGSVVEPTYCDEACLNVRRASSCCCGVPHRQSLCTCSDERETFNHVSPSHGVCMCVSACVRACVYVYVCGAQ